MENGQYNFNQLQIINSLFKSKQVEKSSLLESMLALKRHVQTAFATTSFKAPTSTQPLPTKTESSRLRNRGNHWSHLMCRS